MPGMHAELKLAKGIQVAPADVNSGESGLTVIDLLTGSSEGYALDSSVGGWNPGVPAPKAGLWVDLPFTDGRYPFAGADMNVTETIRLTASAPTHLRMSQILRQLYAMQEDCERFWQDEFAIEPVFLWWWAANAPGRQYALAVSIDIAVSVPTTDDGVTVVRDITLTIEREPYWRGEVPPGANPIYWTLYAQGKQPGLNYDYLADLRLVGTSSFAILYSLANDSLENQVNYTNLTTTVNSISNKNNLSIAASKIPGDAPALLQLTLQHTALNGGVASDTNYSFMVAQSSKKALATMRNNAIARFVTMLPFTAGTYITGGGAGTGVPTADAGGISGFNVTTGTTIAASRLQIAAPFGMNADSIIWTLGLEANIQRGRFAVFMRCRQVGGSAGDITIKVGVIPGRGDAPTFTDTVSPTVQAGAGDTDFWPLLYLGTLRLPPNDNDALLNTMGTQGGSGLFNDSTTDLSITMRCARSTGTGALYLTDLILLPYDEGMVDCKSVDVTTSLSVNSTDTLVLDNTGYLSRGKPNPRAVTLNTLASPSTQKDVSQMGVEQRGPALMLQPNVENNLHILEYTQAGTSTPRSLISAYVNIVPRWRGIRDI